MEKGLITIVCKNDKLCYFSAENKELPEGIRVLNLDEESPYRVFQKGTVRSEGEYLYFSDETLDETVLEKLKEQCKETCDMIEAGPSFSDETISENVFEKNIFDKTNVFSFYGRLISKELCNKVLTYIDERVTEEDIYYVLSYFAASSRHIKDTKHIFPEKQFDSDLSFISSFNEKQGNTEILKKAYGIMRLRKALEPVSSWVTGDEDSMEEEMDRLLETYGKECFIAALVRNYWNRYEDLSHVLKLFHAAPLKDKNVRTIGVYYYHMNIGGAQKVVKLTSEILKKMGYEIVVITDLKEADGDYQIAGAKREYIKPWNEVTDSNYEQRAADWIRIIEDNKIDLILYHAWTSNMLMWDTLLFRSLDTSIITYNHSVFSSVLQKMAKDFSANTIPMSLNDGIICLSGADSLWWRAFNRNVYHLPNPVDPLLKGRKADPEGHNILWVGRFSSEKRPEEAIHILNLVKDKDAVLTLVGGDQDGEYTDLLKKKAEELGLSDRIVFAGYQEDPSPYYEKTSLVLMTSVFEGYPLTMIETMAFGLPLVIYDIAHLDLAKQDNGVCVVGQLDRETAAAKIDELFEDRKYYEELREASADCFEKLCAYDFASMWKKILHGQGDVEPNDPFTDQLIRSIRDNYLGGFLNSTDEERTTSLQKYVHDQVKARREMKEKLQKTYDEKSEINAKLKQAYADKTERGLRIKELEKELEEIKRPLLSKVLRKLK